MAMTNKKILEATQGLHRLLKLDGVVPRRLSEAEQQQRIYSLDYSVQRGHFAFICEEIPRMLDDGRREKVMRWLGWMQGAVWALGYASLEELKDLNKPDPA